MIPIRINLSGRTLDIASPHAAFTAYLKKQFFYHIIDSRRPLDHADIEVQLYWSRSLKKHLTIEEKGLRRIATNTYIGEKECLYMDKINGRRTKVRFEVDGQRLRVSVVQEEKRYLFKKEDQEAMRRACYHFINCPTFFYMQHFHNTHPLHAGAFTVSGKVVVVVGLDTMGKTTLALQSLRHPGASFISDNIIFHDGRSIFPCYTPLKIRKEDRPLVPKSFRDIIETKDRVFFAPPALGDHETKPDYVIIPSFSHEPFMREMTPFQACDAIMNMNILSSEMKEYFNVAALWNLIVAGDPLIVRQNTALRELLKKTKCYSLGIGRAEAPAKTFERLMSLVK